MGLWTRIFGEHKGSAAPPVAPPAPSEPQLPAKPFGVDPAQWFELYGSPLPIHDVETRQEFVSCYDRRLRVPSWVIEHLTPASRACEDGDRKRSFFKEDTRVPELFRSRLQDYFRSGYDRGHQAPAANARFSQQAMDETFYLTNIAPQVGAGFNRDYWAHFERFCRNLVKTYPSVRIITGPLFLPRAVPGTNRSVVSYEVIGTPPTIAVPTHFFKVVVGEDARGSAVAAFVLPNAAISNDAPLADFEVPLDAIERAAGVEFMPKLPLSRRRALCREVTCAVEVVEFIDGVRQVQANAALPGGARAADVPALPAGSDSHGRA